MKVSSTFSKVAGCRGGALARAPQSAELPCALISAGGGLRGNPRRGFPLFFWACTCAPVGWEVCCGPCCDSTPFLWCLPKETVSSRQRKALFYPGGSTIRVSATSRWSGRSSPDLGRGRVLDFGAQRVFASRLPFKSLCWAGRRSRLLDRRRWGRSRPWCRR